MGGKVKQYAGSLLPIVAAVAIAFIPGLAPFAGLIVAGAGLVGAVVGKADMGLGEWEEQGQGAVLLESNDRSTQRTIPVVYGTRKVGSNDVFIDVVGQDSKTLLIVSCLCEGEIEGIEQVDGVDQVYIENELVSEFNEKYQAEYGKDIVTYTLQYGTSTQGPLSYVKWGKTHELDTLRDTAFIVWEIFFRPEIFRTIPSRHVVIKGRKCFDVRSSQWNFTRNPALFLYDYLTNDRFGMALPISNIDVDSFIDAANYCEDASYKEPWLCDYAIFTQLKSQTILDTILAHFRGSFSWFDGKLSLYYADLRAQASVFDLYDEDIARSEDGKALVQVSQPSTSVMPTGVLVKYINKDNDWSVDDVYIGETTGQIKQIELPGFTSRKLAMDMGTYILEREQLNRAFSFVTRPNTIILDPNDVISLYSSEIFANGNEARVVQSEILPDGMIRVSAVMDAAYLYDDVYNPDPEGAYELAVASPFDIPPPIAGVYFEEEIYTYRERSFVRLFVKFDEPVATVNGKAYPWFGHVDVYTASNNDPNDWYLRFSAVDDFTIDPVEDGEVIYFALVSVSKFDVKQPFDEALRANYKVKGLSETPPECVAYLQATVSNGKDLSLFGSATSSDDVAGYEFRMGTAWGSNEWKDATFIGVENTPNLSISGIRSCYTDEDTNDYLLTFFVDSVGQNGLYGGCPAKTDPFLIPVPKPGYKQWLDEVDINTAPWPPEYYWRTESYYDPVEDEWIIQVDRNAGPDAPENKYGTFTTPWINLIRNPSHKFAMLINVTSKWYVHSEGSGNTWSDLIIENDTTWSNLDPDQTLTWKELSGDAYDSSTIEIEAYTKNSIEDPETFEHLVGLERLDPITFAGLNAGSGDGWIQLVFKLTDRMLSQRIRIGESYMKNYILLEETET